jgi:uncharacterized membrane protein
VVRYGVLVGKMYFWVVVQPATYPRTFWLRGALEPLGASKQDGERAEKASKQARWRASEKASKQASERKSKLASKQAKKQASKQASEKAS